MKFEDICQDLKIEWKSKEKEFKEGTWTYFVEALKKKAIKTWTYQEAFLGWLLVLQYKPRGLLELGSQHGHSGLVWMNAMKKVSGLFVALELGINSRNKYTGTSIGTMEFLPDNDPNLIKIWGEAEEKLPDILNKYPIDFVFHDCDHTWDHIENCVSITQNFNDQIIQTCHDCAEGMWKPERETQYGVIHAERPVFDNHYLNNPDFYYAVLEDKYGFGFAIPKEKI
jgi:hypothetical protein